MLCFVRFGKWVSLENLVVTVEPNNSIVSNYLIYSLEESSRLFFNIYALHSVNYTPELKTKCPGAPFTNMD